MNYLCKFLTGAVLCSLLAAASAQEFSYSPALTQEQILNELLASSKYRPKQVATLEGFDMPLVLDGTAAGVVKVKPGVALNVVTIKSTGVVVELNGNQTTLAIEKTDLIARYADRKKEVDREFEEERLALIASGEEIVVLPPVQNIAQVAPDPVTQIVYIDSSQPRIQVNNGAYWPYTNYYPGYAGYVYAPYYNPYYCYQPNYPGPRPGPGPRPSPGPRPFPGGNSNVQVLPPVTHPFGPARGN